MTHHKHCPLSFACIEAFIPADRCQGCKAIAAAVKEERATKATSLVSLAQFISAWRESKGFVTSKENMLEKLMLAVTELSEAAEDVRHARWDHFGEEIADCAIRLLDICGALDIDLESEIAKKMKINEARPYRHGTNVSA